MERKPRETQPISPAPPHPGIPPAFPTKLHPSPSHKSKWLLLVIVGFLILFISVYTIQFLAERNRQKQTAIVTPTISLPSPTPDPTANWKTYTDENFTFKYPQDFIMNDSTKTMQYSIENLEKEIGFIQEKGRDNFIFSVRKVKMEDLLDTEYKDSSFTEPIGDTGAVQNIKNIVTTSKSTIHNIQIVKANITTITDKILTNERYFILIPMKNKTIEFSIDKADQALLDQILSTFKFL